MAKIINNVLAVLILGFAAVPGAATANENDDVRATIAHLFPDALHAAAGTCFPKYHLELWRNDVIAHKKIDDRTSQLKLSGASPCAVSEDNWRMLKRYFRSGINGGDDNADWKPPRLAVTLEGGGSKSAPFAMGALAGASISTLNLEWGSDIANYNVLPSVTVAAHLTPFPLYHVSRERERFSPTIHLSDGGNTDNLGALAAIRHGAANVIVVASTGDGSGNMRSLCRAKNHLELDGTYRVKVPELGRLDWVCNALLGAHERVVWGDKAITKLVC